MKTTLLPLAALLTALASAVAAPPDRAAGARQAQEAGTEVNNWNAAKGDAKKSPDVTAHEWGTFTSVQAEDGVQMQWNPLVIAELPGFVYERARVQTGKPVLAAKIATGLSLQRMETPVIYFYSNKAQTVDVSVSFPSGKITEWYPQKSAANLDWRLEEGLHWPKVEILPASDVSKRQLASPAQLPIEGSGSHYYAARETDAAVLRTTDTDGKTEIEKFLFYRGIGSFNAPLTVKLDSADPQRVSLTNTSKYVLNHLYLCQVKADGIAWVAIEKLAPGETRGATVANSRNTDTASLAAALRKSLASEGLYEKEAGAMVNTWENAWLGERGLRVLYTLPRPWTDLTLHLTITPKPKSIERVMVGRAEIITPAMEEAVIDVAERYLAGPAEARAKVVQDAKNLGMGRFMDPALRRIMATKKRPPAFSAYSLELLEKVAEPLVIKPASFSPPSAAN